MKKCDIIIPVYNSPDWVKLCVYSIFTNTDKDVLNKVYLVDDCSNEFTKNLLKNLKKKYNKIEIITNDKNLGFVKTCNKGLKLSKADYVLLLNTDCIITHNTVSKLINHIENNPKIGLICPVASNAANLTLEMFEGFSFSGMNNLLEKKFLGKNFDACTIVGNCLMISRDCINKVGYLDEIYGMGYGEETDYQFKSMEKGFEAKVAIDTYVFHKSEASFGVSEEKAKRLKKNRDIFFSRWGDKYNKLLKIYEHNDPIKYINNNLIDEDKKINIDTAVYLPDIVQVAGGVHVVVDMINYMSINNANANILYNNISNYKEIMLFNPISVKKIDNIKLKRIVSTIYTSTYPARDIATSKRIPLINFVQGYESYFENGYVYGIVELTYKLADYNLAISNYLKEEITNVFKSNVDIIPNGINLDLVKIPYKKKKPKVITVDLRGNPMKGDWILLDIVKRINNEFNNLTINIVYNNEYVEFPSFTNNTNVINKYLGPLERNEIYKLLQTSDIYIDASLSEGFGLMPLEAMAAGNAVIVSNSCGINEYIKNEYNGYIIDKVNVAEEYIKALRILLNDNNKYNEILNNSYKTVDEYDFDNVSKKYIKYFDSINKRLSVNNKFSESEKIIINAFKKRNNTNEQVKHKVFKYSKLVPKFIKKPIKKFITALYGTYQH